ncbi:hypothetical protein [Microbacterium sp. 2FI]|uniref:hypothetical protein n=1 Tax=Microbacterium sp. 2FI TaxID=2502193 RepID=UPI0010F52B03|nr:hypothetical protein [Microbacterium sp. 2FI]
MPGVPADFRVPPDWPSPTDKWIRDNALWHPPEGWTPVPAATAAPPAWRYWVPNKLWAQTTGAHYRSIAIWARLSNLCAALWLVALAASAFLGSSPMLRIVGWSAAVASLALLIVHESFKAHMSKKLLAQFETLAQHGRQQRLTREYQRYLTAMT